MQTFLSIEIVNSSQSIIVSPVHTCFHSVHVATVSIHSFLYSLHSSTLYLKEFKAN